MSCAGRPDGLMDRYRIVPARKAYQVVATRRMFDEDRTDARIRRNHELLEQAFVVCEMARQLRMEHFLITLRAQEMQPLIRENRRYRRIALGKHDPLVLRPLIERWGRRSRRTCRGRLASADVVEIRSEVRDCVAV